jgi:hypothetical protein
MIGPAQSGRSTIADFHRADWPSERRQSDIGKLGQNFGLQPLIGKPLAIVGDVR